MAEYDLANMQRLFAEAGCAYLEPTYVNTHQKVAYRCQCCGAESVIRVDSFLSGSRCSRCGKTANAVAKRGYSLADIRTVFRNAGCEYLETEYRNNRTRVRYRCTLKQFTRFELENRHTSVSDLVRTA